MYSLRSMSIKAALGLVALLFSAAAAAQINPNQIAWPTGPTGCFYAPGTNSCASASGGSAVPQLVQFVQSSCGAGPCSLLFTNNVGPGNALIYECQHGVAGNCNVTPTDAQGDTFALANYQLVAANFDLAQYVACDAGGGPTTITSASGGTIVAAYEVSGAAIAQCVDANNSGQGNNLGSVSTGSITTTQFNDFIFVSGAARTGGGGTTITEANGYSTLANSGLVASALTYNSWYGIEPAIGSLSDTVSFTSAPGGEYAGILALKPRSSYTIPFWPPGATGPTFSPAPGSIGSGATVKDTCPGSATPWISLGQTPVAGATGVTVSAAELVFGSCQGNGYLDDRRRRLHGDDWIHGHKQRVCQRQWKLGDLSDACQLSRLRSPIPASFLSKSTPSAPQARFRCPRTRPATLMSIAAQGRSSTTAALSPWSASMRSTPTPRRQISSRSMPRPQSRT